MTKEPLKDLRNTTPWKLVGPLVWILIGVLVFINYNWLVSALAFMFLIMCTKKFQ